MNRQVSHRRHQSRAFTIVELLISLGVIAIMISVALYSLQVARRAGARTQTMNALKQIMVGYNEYTAAHDGRLLPGYLDQATLTSLAIKAKLKDGTILPNEDASSYVWRLSPYLDHGWQTFMTDYQSGELESRFDQEYTGAIFGPISGDPATNLCISTRPSFGLNSVYLGGDTTHGDPSLGPWVNPSGRVAALRMAEVKNPAKIIVFAPTRGIGLPAIAGFTPNVPLGYAQLSPPFANFNRDAQAPLLLEWQFDPAAPGPDHISFIGMYARAGVPVDRYGGNKVSIGHLDGSVTTELIDSLGPSTTSPNTLMSRWSPFAVGSN